jgi:RNA polymerase sigma-70 factor, ECF subfamily
MMAPPCPHAVRSIQSTMTTKENVNHDAADLLARWRSGDQQAAAELFRCYAGRLAALARSHLSRKIGQRLDAEDVVQSVYRSFFADARENTGDPG